MTIGIWVGRGVQDSPIGLYIVRHTGTRSKMAKKHGTSYMDVPLIFKANKLDKTLIEKKE